MSANRLTARGFLAREIKRAREATGLSQKELAKAIYVSEALVGAWETSRRVPKPDVMARLVETLGASDMMSRLLDELVSAEVPLEWLGKWLAIEEQATTLLWFETTVVCGLLQTEDYARAVLQAGRHHLTDTEEMVGARLDRQRILTKDDPPILVVLMAESILRQNVGGPKVMHDQLIHLATMAERDNVVAHIVPSTATVCAGFIGHFVIANFDSGGEVAYVDNQLHGEVVERVEEVALLRRMFELFRAGALSKKESTELIVRMAEQWST